MDENLPSDTRVMFDAIQWWAKRRREYTCVIAQKNYLMRDGSVPTEECVKYAFLMADQAERLAVEWYHKWQQEESVGKAVV